MYSSLEPHMHSAHRRQHQQANRPLQLGDQKRARVVPPPQALPSNSISLQQYDECELLWLEYRSQLSISKSAALWALQVRGTVQPWSDPGPLQSAPLPTGYALRGERARACVSAGILREHSVLLCLTGCCHMPAAGASTSVMGSVPHCMKQRCM